MRLLLLAMAAGIAAAQVATDTPPSARTSTTEGGFINMKPITETTNISWVNHGENVTFTLTVRQPPASLGWIGFGIGEPTSGFMDGSDMAILIPATGQIKDMYTARTHGPHSAPEDGCEEFQNWHLVSLAQSPTETVWRFTRYHSKGLDATVDRELVDDGVLTRIVFAFGQTGDSVTSSLLPHRSADSVATALNLFNRPMKSDTERMSEILRLPGIRSHTVSFKRKPGTVVGQETYDVGSGWWATRPGAAEENGTPMIMGILQENAVGKSCHHFTLGGGSPTHSALMWIHSGHEAAVNITFGIDGFGIDMSAFTDLFASIHYADVAGPSGSEFRVTVRYLIIPHNISTTSSTSPPEANPAEMQGGVVERRLPPPQMIQDNNPEPAATAALPTYFGRPLIPATMVLIGVNHMHTPRLVLPPGDASFVSTTLTSTCTRNWLGGKNTTFYTYQPHQHARGNGVSVVIRDSEGKVRHTLATKFTVYSKQRNDLLSEPIIIRSGDSITTTCRFANVPATPPLVFGPSYLDEMCYFWSLHDPVGASFPNPAQLGWREIEPEVDVLGAQLITQGFGQCPPTSRGSTPLPASNDGGSTVGRGNGEKKDVVAQPRRSFTD